MKRLVKGLAILFAIMVMMSAFITVSYADVEDSTTSNEVTIMQAAEQTKGDKALAAGIAIGLAALGGAIGMGMAISKSAEGISRQPEADGKIRTTLMLGLVFIETAIIYALVIAILIVFVL